MNFRNRHVLNRAPKLIRLTLLLLMALAIASCGGNPRRVDSEAPALFGSVTDPEALRYLQSGNVAAAADVYQRRAMESDNLLRQQDYLLVAAEIVFDRGTPEAGAPRLQQVPTELATLALQQRRDILVAKQYLGASQAQAALDALPLVDAIESPLHRARVFETQANAWRLLDNPAGELTARIALEEQLNNRSIAERNHVQIWQLLQSQPASRLQEMNSQQQDNETYQGWLALALASAAAGYEPDDRNAALREWSQRFPRHPANGQFLRKLAEPTQFAGFTLGNTEVTHIGVLLPMSDERLTAPSAAIRDGIVAAQQFAARRNMRTPTLSFHDVGSDPAWARNAYQDALNQGADAIIGPLRKEAVASIVTLRQVPRPTVTLNTVDDFIAGPTRNIIQFGLSPEDEARSAADRAIAQSMTRAVILQADDARGDREARAFQEEMLRYGGDVVHVGVLPVDTYDYSDQIREALLIDQSDARFRSISRTIGKKLFFEPTIRNDVDVVFLALGSEQARSVRPQLDFFHAMDIPRLGTSRIASNTDDERHNKDLNTIYFADAPWVLNRELDKDALKQEIIATFPGATGAFGKLYALGIDAYMVSTNLQALSEGGNLSGYTGDLSLSRSGRVQRELDWAQYQEGVVVGVERTTLPNVQPLFGGME